MNLLVFTCADRNYEDFAPLYVASVLCHTRHATAEIGLEDASAFSRTNAESIAILTHALGRQRFRFRTVEWCRNGRRILPNSVRFVQHPSIKADYVYVGDIDVIILDRDFYSRHIEQMQITGLPYSNVIRPKTTRMSGLHFSRYDVLYPLPNIDDIDLARMNDEMVLYEICKRKGLSLENAGTFRPVHGIHLSPNRTPLPRKINGRVIPGWGIRGYAKAYLEFASSELMRSLRPSLSKRVQGLLSQVDEIAKSKPAECNTPTGERREKD